MIPLEKAVKLVEEEKAYFMKSPITDEPRFHLVYEGVTYYKRQFVHQGYEANQK